MPSHKEHCKYTKETYGVEASDIHSWMDEPFIINGESYKEERHDPLQEIPEVFINKYGYYLAWNIMIDHIMFDNYPELYNKIIESKCK